MALTRFERRETKRRAKAGLRAGRASKEWIELSARITSDGQWTAKRESLHAVVPHAGFSLPAV